MYLSDVTSGTDVFTLKCACSTILLDSSSRKMFSVLRLLFSSCIMTSVKEGYCLDVKQRHSFNNFNTLSNYDSCNLIKQII